MGCGERPEWAWGLGARKTPHRIRPKTAESASPLGEGEERRPLDWIETEHRCYPHGREYGRSCLGGLGALCKGLPMERVRVAPRGWGAASGPGGLGGWVPGRPLTEFGRRRPILPLPSERAKNGDPGGRCSTLAWLLHRGSHPHPSPLPLGDLCVTQGWLRGRPLSPTLSPRRGIKTRLHTRARGAFCNGLPSLASLASGDACGPACLPRARAGRLITIWREGPLRPLCWDATSLHLDSCRRFCVNAPRPCETLA